MEVQILRGERGMEDEGRRVPVSSVRPLEAPGVAPLRYVSLKNPPSGSKMRDQTLGKGGEWMRMMQERIEEIQCFNDRDVPPCRLSCLSHPITFFLHQTYVDGVREAGRSLGPSSR